MILRLIGHGARTTVGVEGDGRCVLDGRPRGHLVGVMGESATAELVYRRHGEEIRDTVRQST